jgi:hypothetical protein
MDWTWRLERPEATITTSQSEERPARLMVTMSSALSSSSEFLIRLRRSLSGTAILFALALTPWAFAFGFGFGLALAGFFAGAFLGDFLTGLLTAFLAAGFLALALDFLAGLRVSSSGYGANLARAHRPLQGLSAGSHFRDCVRHPAPISRGAA